MSKFRLMLLVFGIFLANFANVFGLGPQELSRVTFVNETGNTIKYLFASASEAQEWGPDLLGDKEFIYGDNLTYFVHHEDDCALFDFYAIDSLDNAYIIQSVKLCQKGDAVMVVTVSDFVARKRHVQISRVFLTNATNSSLQYVFFAPSKTRHWGFDILRSDMSLEPGATIEYAVPVGTKNSQFDILAIAKDRTLIQHNLELSASKPAVYIDFTVEDLH